MSFEGDRKTVKSFRKGVSFARVRRKSLSLSLIARRFPSCAMIYMIHTHTHTHTLSLSLSFSLSHSPTLPVMMRHEIYDSHTHTHTHTHAHTHTRSLSLSRARSLSLFLSQPDASRHDAPGAHCLFLRRIHKVSLEDEKERTPAMRASGSF